jgi:hypothetical protein
MTESRISKNLILHACTIKQQLTIADFEKEIEAIKDEVTAHSETASQEHRGAAEQNSLLVRLEHELLFLKNELMLLESLDEDKISAVVEPGAVVVTDQRIFFISTSIEEVEVNGKNVFGLSTHAPIYAEM